MPKFRSRPVEVEAVQFTQEVRDAILFDGAVPPDGAYKGSSWTHPGRREVYRASFYVNTGEFRQELTLDDWIVTHADGSRSIVDCQEFPSKYEAA